MIIIIIAHILQPFSGDSFQGRALWWNSDIRTLSKATANIGEIKMGAADILRKKGFPMQFIID